MASWDRKRSCNGQIHPDSLICAVFDSVMNHNIYSIEDILIKLSKKVLIYVYFNPSRIMPFSVLSKPMGGG